MPQTNFQLLKLVLDELYTEVEDEFGAKADSKINAELDALSTAYQKLNRKSTPKIDYSSAVTRFAYVYRYVGAHADYIYQMLDSDDDAAGILNNEMLRLTCLGGGPGSEIVGILKFIARRSPKVKWITCYLCDQEQAWADSWTDISERSKLGRKLGLTLNANFQGLDVTDPRSWSKQKKFLTADLFTLSFFVSEVVRFESAGLAAFWEALFTQSRKGAHYLFIDNAHTDFTGYFDGLHKKYRLKVITSRETNITPSIEEEKSDLGRYIKKFGSPKLRQDLAYRLLVR